MDIAIITGGTSRERDIAIQSSKIFQEHIAEADYYLFPEDLERFLKNHKKYELVIPVFHGVYGEDGQVFAFLKTLGIGTAFSPWEVHALTIDKFVTDTLIRRAHPVPNEFIIKRGMPIPTSPWPYPIVVKPNRGGSTIGTNLVKDMVELEWAVKEIHTNHHDDALVQNLLTGREFCVSLIGNTDPEVLGITEIFSKSALYDTEEKYQSLDSTVCPARLEPDFEAYIKAKSREIYIFLGLRGIGSIDWRCDASGVAHFLEVNTIPGLNAGNIFMKAARSVGYTEKTLVEKIVMLARE